MGAPCCFLPQYSLKPDYQNKAGLNGVRAFLMDSILYFFASRFALILVKLISLTYRVQHVNAGVRERAAAAHPKGGFLLACWHEHLVSTLVSQQGWPYTTLASHSRAGRVIGFVCRGFGYEMIYGSQNRAGKDKGGLQAIRGLLKSVNGGKPTAVTVDGSVGPRREVKSGIIDIGRRTGAGIIPFASAASSYWELPTWDRFKLPKPFAKIVVSYGEPFFPDKEADKALISSYQSEVARQINHQEQEAATVLRQRNGSII